MNNKMTALIINYDYDREEFEINMPSHLYGLSDS